MKTLYLDCPMGVSGDMFLAAMIDLGADPEHLLADVRSIPGVEREIDVTVSTAVRHSITCMTFRVAHTEAPGHRTFREIKKLIRTSALDAGVKKLSTEIFRRIAEAEGRVHGISPERVHFHEVGAIDSIIDIVGAASAVAALGIEQVVSSPLPLGSGWANTMHGRIPIPAPATLEILKGAPVASSTAPFELTTPTGAAIVATLASAFGPMPAMVVEATGYGAGKKDFKGSANLLRAVIGEAMPIGAGGMTGSVGSANLLRAVSGEAMPIGAGGMTGSVGSANLLRAVSGEAVPAGAGDMTGSEGSANLPRAVIGKTKPKASGGVTGAKGSANLPRAVMGKAKPKEDPEAGCVVVIETNIDDMTPKVAGYLMERLLEAGALDVFYTPVQMKKNRPGVLLTVLAGPGKKEPLVDIIFSESTTIGVRSYIAERECLGRRTVRVKTPYGRVSVKLSVRAGVLVNAEPEYEDCRTLARQKGVPIREVIDSARAEARQLQGTAPGAPQ